MQLTRSYAQRGAGWYNINHLLKGPVNSIISSAWPNQTYSHILSYWLIVCGYEISANRRAVSLSALASFKYTTTTNYTNDRALLKNIIKVNL